MTYLVNKVKFTLHHNLLFYIDLNKGYVLDGKLI